MVPGAQARRGQAATAAVPAPVHEQADDVFEVHFARRDPPVVPLGVQAPRRQRHQEDVDVVVPEPCPVPVCVHVAAPRGVQHDADPVQVLLGERVPVLVLQESVEGVEAAHELLLALKADVGG